MFEILKTHTVSWKWFATCCLEKYLLLFACVWLVWLGFLTDLTGSFGMLMNSEVAKQARRATLFFSFWDKIMIFYQLKKKIQSPSDLSNLFSQEPSDTWRCWFTWDLSGRESEPSSLLTPWAVHWPIPDWRPISHVWLESSTVSVAYKVTYGHLICCLFLTTPRTYFHPASNNQGSTGWRVPVIQVMNLR